ELFSGLSLAEVASIVPIIEKLRQQGKTIIMIEHRKKASAYSFFLLSGI
ncbi:unnamed protein product, partial [marine sediment metagenome]